MVGKMLWSSQPLFPFAHQLRRTLIH